jgi:hypothetical protein
MAERRAAFQYQFCVVAKNKSTPLAVLRYKLGCDIEIQAQCVKYGLNLAGPA